MVEILLREIEWHKPVELFRAFKAVPWAHCFHSGDHHKGARWSTIVACPSRKIICKDGNLYLDNKRVRGSLIDILRDALSLRNGDRHNLSAKPSDCNAIPFISGLAGYIGYEIGSIFEPNLSLPKSPYKSLPDLALARYEAAVVFDRQNLRAYIAHIDDDVSHYAAAQLFEIVSGYCPKDYIIKSTPVEVVNIASQTDQTKYCAQVSKIIDAILKGDFFQANLSRQIKVTLKNAPDITALYADMIAKSDAAYAALLQFDEGNILSNSPEKFFSVERLKNGTQKIIAEPIKGTIERGQTPEQDILLAQKLLSNKKDRAENIMIADLLRNDLSRVCTPISIHEEEICGLMSLTYVHHLVSRITGVLRSDQNSLDALAALFPCGSITGAPKIEAMKSIAYHEEIGRGPYCGAIGYFDERGGADLSVAIRTLIHDRDEVDVLSIPVGGGVTLRSDPQSEYRETDLKASTFMNLLNAHALSDKGVGG